MLQGDGAAALRAEGRVRRAQRGAAVRRAREGRPVVAHRLEESELLLQQVDGRVDWRRLAALDAQLRDRKAPSLSAALIH